MIRILSILLALGLVLSASAITVTVPSTATVTTEQMLLGDVAVITECPDNVQKLAQVALGASPQPGLTRTLTPEMIHVRLRQFGFDPATLTLVCPPTVQITRLATAVDGATLVETAKAWLTQQLAPAPGEQLELTATRIPLDAKAPVGPVNITCAPAGLNVGTLRHVMVTLTVNNKPAWQGLISFYVKRYAEVLVLRAAVPRGESVNPLALAKELRDISTVTGAPLRDPAEVDGKRATTSLAVGAVLTVVNLEPIPLVKKGQSVRVQAHCGALLISTMAVAMEDGGAGAVIRVSSPDTRLPYAARILGPSLLELVM